MADGLKLIAAPAEEPVSLAEAKRRLRVTVAAEDDDITALVAECRELAEAECRRAFVTQTWSLFLDGFPRGCEPIRFPLPPLQSVTWIKYQDADGDEQTLDAATYFVAPNGPCGRVVLAPGAYWPTTQLGRPESVEVRFVAGYGLAAAVPRAVKAAILELLADRHANPDGGDRGIPPAARRALDGLDNREPG